MKLFEEMLGKQEDRVPLDIHPYMLLKCLIAPAGSCRPTGLGTYIPLTEKNKLEQSDEYVIVYLFIPVWVMHTFPF